MCPQARRTPMIFVGSINTHPCIQPKQDLTSLVLHVILCFCFSSSWSSAKQTLMQPMNTGTHHCITPASGAKTKWLRLVCPLVVWKLRLIYFSVNSHHDKLLKCPLHQSLLLLRTLWLMGLRWASVTNMGKLPWTKPNLTCVNSSEVSWLRIPTDSNAFFTVFVFNFLIAICPSATQTKLRKWDRVWLKFPSRTRSGKAPPELDPVSPTHTFYELTTFHLLVWSECCMKGKNVPWWPPKQS